MAETRFTMAAVPEVHQTTLHQVARETSIDLQTLIGWFIKVGPMLFEILKALGYLKDPYTPVNPEPPLA